VFVYYIWSVGSETRFLSLLANNFHLKYKAIVFRVPNLKALCPIRLYLVYTVPVPCSLLQSGYAVFYVPALMLPFPCSWFYSPCSVILLLCSCCLYCGHVPNYFFHVLYSMLLVPFPRLYVGCSQSYASLFCYPFLCYRFHVLCSSMSELPCSMLHISCYFAKFSTIFKNILEAGISLCTEEFMINVTCSMLYRTFPSPCFMITVP
jgi:hypothetical protein